ncbi:MAG: hypothetical protein WC495_02135 [Patescibacteria group bacterium]|jgi:hypothetical protein
MAIFIPNENIEKNQSFGQAVNKAIKEYIEPELKCRNLIGFSVAGIEILSNGTHKIYIDNDVQIMLEFKNRKLNPNDTGKLINVDLHEIKDVKWHNQKFTKNSAKILIIHFNKDWWIWNADFKKVKGLEEKFRVTTTRKVRGGGYLPLEIRKQEKKEFFQSWRTGLEKELPAMWKRHITVSQRYRGAMVYDGNYFDLFSHAQELYVLGYYYSSIVICRTAAEQALIRILLKVGKGFEIYYPKKKSGRLIVKGIRDLVKTCRDSKLFHGKYPINKTADKKLCEIAATANDLVHPKHELNALDVYKGNALKCMDNLQYVIKHHLNFIKDTGAVSGYRLTGSAKRLR